MDPYCSPYIYPIIIDSIFFAILDPKPIIVASIFCSLLNPKPIVVVSFFVPSFIPI